MSCHVREPPCCRCACAGGVLLLRRRLRVSAVPRRRYRSLVSVTAAAGALSAAASATMHSVGGKRSAPERVCHQQRHRR